MSDIRIEQVDAAVALLLLSDLIGLLNDAVESGASVGFLAPLDRLAAESYWQDRIGEVASGHRVLLLAYRAKQIVGSAQLKLETQPNGAHRAELQRLLVLQNERRQGIGQRFIEQAECIAANRGRSLITLNTRHGDLPEQIYLRRGYQPVGQISRFAQDPDGTFNTTTILYLALPVVPGT